MARPRQDTPDARIAELAGKGMGREAIVAQLKRDGTPMAPATVGRRMAEIKAGAKPPSRPKAGPAKKTPPPVASPARVLVAPPTPPGDQAPEDFEGVDIEHLPAELLTRASTRAFEVFQRELGPGGDVFALDKIATVLERFAKRLVEVRPPEKLDPVKDPANVEARREILARWELLRDPYEVSVPVVDQLQAHVDALRARATEAA